MNEDLLKSMEENMEAVSFFTGVKQQFINAGWTPANAELMVLEMMRASAKKFPEKK